jgi:cell pole-organizing protein PopZ
MSESNAQEPTMEEILASIRRIISEDDAPAAAAPEAEAAGAEPEPEPEPAPPPVLAAEPEEEEDILELMDPEPPAPEATAAVESIGDLEVFAPAPRAQPAPPPRAEPAFSAYEADDDDADDTLISPPSANQAASAFGALSRSLAMPSEGRTLEDVVREMLRPMLKDWLDTNLPSIVETAVQAEVERISRRRL